MNLPGELRYVGARIMREVKEHVISELVPALEDFQNSIRMTPVYTGRTIVNFRWSLNAPIEARRAAVANPALPGKTSDLTIGKEPRRAANEGIVEAEFLQMLSSLRLNPFQKIFLTNNLPNYTDVEYGIYATGARTPPGGIVRSGEAKIRMRVSGVRKVV